MVIDARERFIQRMAATMAATRETDNAAQAKERFVGHDPMDKAKAHVISVGLSKGSPKSA